VALEVVLELEGLVDLEGLVVLVGLAVVLVCLGNLCWNCMTWKDPCCNDRRKDPRNCRIDLSYPTWTNSTQLLMSR